MERTSAGVRHLLVASFVAVSGAVALAMVQGRSGEAAGSVGDWQFVPNQVLVQYQRDAGQAEQESARGRVGGRREDVVLDAREREDGGGDLEVMTLPPGLGIAAAVARLRAHPAVEFAEPNWVYHHEATANDPYYTNGSLWGMYGATTSPANHYGSRAAEAWAAGHTTGSASPAVYVGIIDEGFMHSHEDLAANAWINPYDPRRRRGQRRQRLRGRRARLGLRRATTTAPTTGPRTTTARTWLARSARSAATATASRASTGT